MVEILRFLFRMIGSFFNLLDTFIIYDSISYLDFLIACILIPLIIKIVKFGFTEYNSTDDKTLFKRKEKRGTK